MTEEQIQQAMDRHREAVSQGQSVISDLIGKEFTGANGSVWRFSPNGGVPLHRSSAAAAGDSQATMGDGGLSRNPQIGIPPVDPDWEPDHAIISRLRENERLDAARIKELDERNEILFQELVHMTQQRNDLTARIGTPPESSGNHPYHGPTAPDPENPGQRKAVPDPVHEEVHRTVGHVLAGKVIPEARRQLQEALKNAPKEAKPFPNPATRGTNDDPRRMGFPVR